MTFADQLTLARILAVPVVIVLAVASFDGHYWWATGVFIAAMTTDWFDGRVARRYGYSSALAIILFVTVFGAANIYVKALNAVKNR